MAIPTPFHVVQQPDARAVLLPRHPCGVTDLHMHDARAYVVLQAQIRDNIAIYLDPRCSPAHVLALIDDKDHVVHVAKALARKKRR